MEKFRVWDNLTNFYDEFKLYAMDELGDLYRIDGASAVDLSKDKNRYVIEMFTGLRDKNGKLIYEGDIVTFERLGAKIKGRVHYKDYSLKINDYMACGFTDEDLEVIGNIHEDKELLDEVEK